ncbi:MAG: M23 family metallopeptidase [Candidatus Omnitrophica bacterium]|nr:M23 family metallopeptidase [Candidatus Omnitrophota bacterium]
MAVRFRSPALLCWMGLFFVLSGCTPYRESQRPQASAGADPTHQVLRGETLWSIARRYEVPVDDLARLNGISDASKLESGQTLVLPEPIPPGLRASPSPSTRRVGDAEAGGRVAVADSSRFVWPVRGRVISIFGARRRGTVNKGIDIQAQPGTEVVAARGGHVSYVHESLPGFGKTIIIEHGDGFASVYAYVSEILVRQGDRVSQRQQIARVGRTGRTEVPALHFEIRRGQKPQNPLRYLP